ncbi:MAG: SAVED domain-containing protein [Paludibacteraceae bacterium]|nr:SAVED domain-containing protein [Paludibacteraceae bacterium]
MSGTKIPKNIQNLLWAKSAGRCEFSGCNKILYEDLLTKKSKNLGYVAHIIADSPNGPRGSEKDSEELAKDVNNLMLLCDSHHRLVDGEPKTYTKEVLIQMKKEHEDRVKTCTEVKEDKQTTIVLYGANIGEKSTVLSYDIACQAISPKYYSLEGKPIELGIINTLSDNADDEYWKTEGANLQVKFERYVNQYIRQGEITHISLFAIAPMPLLVKLGTLLDDLVKVEVYQKHSEPDTWRWLDDESVNFKYIINEPSNKKLKPCLIFALSSSAITERVTSNLKDCSIWEMTIDNPNNDFLRSRKQLSEFRKEVRKLLDVIKKESGFAELNVFMSMPVACAVEFGRVWMPKADMTLNLYDYNTKVSEFDKLVLTINNK